MAHSSKARTRWRTSQRRLDCARLARGSPARRPLTSGDLLRPLVCAPPPPLRCRDTVRVGNPERSAKRGPPSRTVPRNRSPAYLAVHWRRVVDPEGAQAGPGIDLDAASSGRLVETDAPRADVEIPRHPRIPAGAFVCGDPGARLSGRHGARHERGPSVLQPAPLVEQIASRVIPLDSPAHHCGRQLHTHLPALLRLSQRDAHCINPTFG